MLSRCYTISGNKVEVSASHLITRRVHKVNTFKIVPVLRIRVDISVSTFLLHWRCLTITELMINEQIRDKEVRLISDTGEQLGIVSSKEAQKIADEKNSTSLRSLPTPNRRFAELWTMASISLIRPKRKRKPVKTENHRNEGAQAFSQHRRP